MAINRIDSTPVRINSTVSPSSPSSQSNFGGKLSSPVSGGLTAPFVPGGAIVSAAVSSNLTQGQGGAVSSQYAFSGAIPVTATGAGGSTGTGAIAPTTGGSAGGTVNYAPGTGGGTVAQMQSDLIAAQQENGRLMQVQMQMQRENQVFSTVSNVLKVRHDTVKNTIQNVR